MLLSESTQWESNWSYVFDSNLNKTVQIWSTVDLWPDLQSRPPHFSLFFFLAPLHLILERLCFININLTPLKTFSSVSAGGEVKGGVFGISNMQNSRSCHQRRARAFYIAWDVIFSPTHVIFLSSWVIRAAILDNFATFVAQLKYFQYQFFFIAFQRNSTTPSAWRSWKRQSSTQRRFGKQRLLLMSLWSHWMVRKLKNKILHAHPSISLTLCAPLTPAANYSHHLWSFTFFCCVFADTFGIFVSGEDYFTSLVYNLWVEN